MKTAEEWFDENQANYKGIKSTTIRNYG